MNKIALIIGLLFSAPQTAGEKRAADKARISQLCVPKTFAIRSSPFRLPNQRQRRRDARRRGEPVAC